MLHITAGELIHVGKPRKKLPLLDFSGSLAVFGGFQTAPPWISGDQRQKTCYKNMTY